MESEMIKVNNEGKEKSEFTKTNVHFEQHEQVEVLTRMIPDNTEDNRYLIKEKIKEIFNKLDYYDSAHDDAFWNEVEEIKPLLGICLNEIRSCKNTADILINEFKKRKGSSFKLPISRSASISKEKIDLFKKPKTPDYHTRLKLEKLKHKDFKAMTMRSTPKRTKVSVEVTKSIKKRQEEKREREEKAKRDKEEKLKKDKDDKIKEMKAFRERQKEKEDRIREEKALKEKEKKEKEEKEKKDKEEKEKKKKEEKERKAAEKKEKAEHDKIEKERYMKSKLLKAQMMLEAKKNENKDKEKNDKESKDKNKQSKEKNIIKGDKDTCILEKINRKPSNADDNNNNSNDEQIEPVREIIEKSIKQNEAFTA